MTKLCPRGKAAAKRKFRVYPSAYANANKNDKKTNSIELIKKRKDSKKEALEKMKKELGMKNGGMIRTKETLRRIGKVITPGAVKTIRKFVKESKAKQQDKARVKKMGGGLMEATERLRRQGLKRGGRGCKLAMKGRGRAYGKNS